jgi:hypothetical protein
MPMVRRRDELKTVGKADKTEVKIQNAVGRRLFCFCSSEIFAAPQRASRFSLAIGARLSRWGDVGLMP